MWWKYNCVFNIKLPGIKGLDKLLKLNFYKKYFNYDISTRTMISPDRCRVGDGFESRPNAVSQLKKLKMTAISGARQKKLEQGE